jgi:hypothetical protein
MYQLTYRAALRMERRLPSGTPTPNSWIVRNRVIDSSQLGLSSHWSSHGQVLWDDSPSFVFREALNVNG